MRQPWRRRRYSTRLPDRDVWAAAMLMMKRYRDDAMLEAAQRADQLLDDGDMAANGTSLTISLAGFEALVRISRV